MQSLYGTSLSLLCWRCCYYGCSHWTDKFTMASVSAEGCKDKLMPASVTRCPSEELMCYLTYFLVLHLRKRFIWLYHTNRVGKKPVFSATELSKTGFKSDEGEKPGEMSQNDTTVFPLVGSHAVPALSHSTAWLENVAKPHSPLIPIRPAPNPQNSSTAVPQQRVWPNVLWNNLCCGVI